MQKLKDGKYTLEDLVIDNPSKGRNLGTYQDKNMVLVAGFKNKKIK